LQLLLLNVYVIISSECYHKTVGGLVLILFRREVIDMVTYSDMFAYTLVLCAVVTLVVTVCNMKSKK